MALLKTPSEIQPAYNEIEFVDDAATVGIIQGVEPADTTVVQLRRVQQKINDPANPGTYVTASRFDISGLVRSLFSGYCQPINTGNSMPVWAYADSDLAVLYTQSFDDVMRAAVNAVRQAGEGLDLYRDGRSPLLTRVQSTPDLSVKMLRAYEGFPVGVSVMSKYAEMPEKIVATAVNGAVDSVIFASGVTPVVHIETTPGAAGGSRLIRFLDISIGDNLRGVKIDFGDTSLTPDENQISYIAGADWMLGGSGSIGWNDDITGFNTPIWDNGLGWITSQITVPNDRDYIVTAVYNLYDKSYTIAAGTLADITVGESLGGKKLVFDTTKAPRPDLGYSLDLDFKVSNSDTTNAGSIFINIDNVDLDGRLTIQYLDDAGVMQTVVLYQNSAWVTGEFIFPDYYDYVVTGKSDSTTSAPSTFLKSADIDIFAKGWSWIQPVATVNFSGYITQVYLENAGISVLFEPTCVPDRPFYVRWINRDAGYDYFMFSARHRHTRAVSDSTDFTRFSTSTPGVRGVQNRIAFEAKEVITAGVEQVAFNDFESLSLMQYSPKIEWFDTTAHMWRVIMFEGDTSTVWRSDGAQGNVEFKFLLPAPNTQQL